MSMGIWWFVLVTGITFGLGVVWGYALRAERHHCPAPWPQWLAEEVEVEFLRGVGWDEWQGDSDLTEEDPGL